MEIKVERIDVTKSYDRNKIYTPVDITSQVVMPIIDVERLDTTLDTSSITLINDSKTPLKPFSRMKITITNNDGSKEKIYRLVYTDNVEKLNYTTQERYKHYLELIEPTKWLERFEVDNTTITNYLAWLYHEGEGKVFETANPNYTNDIIQFLNMSFTVSITNGSYIGADYIGSTRIKTYYVLNGIADINVRLKPTYQFTSQLLLIPIGDFTITGTLDSYYITDPNLNITDAKNLTTFTFDTLGKYKFTQVYKATQIDSNGLTKVVATTTYTWEIQCVSTIQDISLPQRYTIRAVCENILNRVGDDSSTIREGIELPMFQLGLHPYNKPAESLYNILEERISPEFTFTQNTLFGVLSQIGNEIHAIPRLIPTPITINNEDGTTTIDDYSQWNTITFEFLGGSEPTENGEELGYEGTQNGDNYATSFVSNIQNSFQTNNADYISLTEPHSDGFISTRTEEADYEVSDNSACIKTSRPIQRIVSLQVWWANGQDPVEISSFVKESTDYSLLLDYPKTIAGFVGYTSKSSAIYYTRGDNVIRGLDYVPPTKYSWNVITQTQAIKNIIGLATGTTPNVALKDLMFRIKYVPFYNLKAKQFKQYIDENSGDNELFYNQNNTQSVDIESLGENIKGALLRTANEEPTITAKYNDAKNIIHAGQLSSNGYYAYEVNKEITNNRIKATTKFSKDWNKLNEYVAIKKNYREWEISEKESIETTPTYNEFCIISNELDFEKGNFIPEENEEEKYINALDEYGGFLSDRSLHQMFARFAQTNYIPHRGDNVFVKDLPIAVNKYYYHADGFGNNIIDFVIPNTNNYKQNEKIYINRNLFTITYVGEKQFIFMDEPVITATVFTVIVPSGSPIITDINNNENLTIEVLVDLRAIEWVVATCKSQQYLTYRSEKDSNDDLVIRFGKIEINEDYITYTQKDDYVGYYVMDGTTETLVTNDNATHLSISPGTTPCYISLPITYDISFIGSTLILTENVSHDNPITYTATDETNIEVKGVNYVIETTGSGDNLVVVLTLKESEQTINSFLLPASCCSFGNSILINFGANDNYGAATYIEEANKEEGGKYYALESAVRYTDDYGKVNTISLIFGTNVAKMGGFDDYATALQTSKEYYKFDVNNIDVNNVVLDYSKHDFTINKDSRQALNFTNQLHFVSDIQDIWIGKALAQSMPFCGNTEENILKFVYFTKKPDKFCQTRDSSIWTEITMPTCSLDYDLKYIKYNATTLPEDAVGFGLVDNQNRIVLYYNKEIKAGYLNVPEQESAPPFELNTYYSKNGDGYTLLTEQPADWAYNYTNYYYLEYTEPIYFQFRRKI